MSDRCIEKITTRIEHLWYIRQHSNISDTQKILWGRYYSYSYVTDMETKAQRGQITCPDSFSF